MMLDLKELCLQYKIEPRGVIHIGAHEGTEITTYQKMGIRRVLFIEANPTVFERLNANVAGVPGIDTVNCAISNENSVVALHVTSMDQSSSILPLKRHKEIYPAISETHQIAVQSKKLDTLLEELRITPADFNIINIDIQGAELLAFQGAVNSLKYIEAINTEVNYEELYEGCALIHQIDEFLKMFGFERVSTTTPYHPSWGDAFYVKRPVVVNQKQLITMSTLGKNGRFANQIFQYAFLKIYAKEHNCRIETSEWTGRYLFGHKDPPISQQLPIVRIFLPQDKNSQKFPGVLIIDNPEPLFRQNRKPVEAVDFWGYFQFNTKYYASYKGYFRSLFKPVLDIKVKLDKAFSHLRSMGKTIVGLHLRRLDYGYGPFFIAPSEWYIEWLDSLWNSLDKPVLFIASDDRKKVVKAFEQYEPVTSRDLDIEMPETEFYPDFYFLSQSDIVAISNSSFSFAACMLNENCELFVRPHLRLKKLIPFDPWNSDVLSYDEEVIQSIHDNLQAGNLKKANDLCKEIIKTHPIDVIRFATISIERAIQTNHPYDDTCIILGMALQEVGQEDRAMSFYEMALDLNPNHPEAICYFKNIYESKKCLQVEEVRSSMEIEEQKSCTAALNINRYNKIYKENHTFLDKSTFIICAMFTPNKPRLFQYADRLLKSCEQYNLPYSIFEVPAIHKSITPHGQDDLTFTKANFIASNMERFPAKNILYLDIDVFFVGYPDVIVEISNSGYDFAIYNWLNDEHNEAYKPINMKLEAGNPHSDFYIFSHCIGYLSSQQLVCSGAVQFYKNSVNAKYLLEVWQNVIANNAGYADDECLDYAFNNFVLHVKDLKLVWLDKSYLRYPWWPHIKPVILHSDLPAAGRQLHLTEIDNLKRFYPELCRPKSNLFLFPPDCIIDTKNRLLLKIANGQIVDEKELEQSFWIYPESIGM